jgi:hypothetical protein
MGNSYSPYCLIAPCARRRASASESWRRLCICVTCVTENPGPGQSLTPSVGAIVLRVDRPAAPEPPQPARYAVERLRPPAQAFPNVK